jgi:hypothetical protein
MRKRAGGYRVFGIVLAGCLLAGCFVPIIYGGYKLYESTNVVGISVNIKEPAEKVYLTAINLIEKRNIYKILERNDKDMILSLQVIKKEEIKATAKFTVLTPRSSTLSIVSSKLKDVDPNLQKRELVNAVISTCSELGYSCSEEKEK